MSEEVWPVVVDEVDDQPLDVGAILILISHYHQFPIAQCLKLSGVSVLLAVLQAKDLDNIGDLLITHDLKYTEKSMAQYYRKCSNITGEG